MRNKMMAVTKGALAVAMAIAFAGQATAQELSEKSVQVFMDYAWALVPQQYSKKDGTVIVVDKNKRAEVMVPLDIAGEVIRVGRISAHAQVCNLPQDQTLNYRSLMKREVDRKKWTDQQLLYLSQLHLTTVMLLTGKIRVSEAEGEKKVIVDEKSEPTQTCTEEQRQKVKERIAAYVKAGPALASNEAAPPPATTGSTTPAANTTTAPKTK